MLSINRMRLKGIAKGNKDLEMEDRFYVEINFSKQLEQSEPLSMYFKRTKNAGFLIDKICKERSIKCKNHIPGERKLVLVCARMNFVIPFDIPLKLLEPNLLSGDTIILQYEDESTKIN
eukprot:UN05820